MARSLSRTLVIGLPASIASKKASSSACRSMRSAIRRRTPVASRRPAPGSLVDGRPGRSNGGLDVRRPRLGDGGDGSVVPRRDGRERRPVRGGHEAAADEEPVRLAPDEVPAGIGGEAVGRFRSGVGGHRVASPAPLS
jgi:hypothetical protein